jgi:hypothetical protein
MFYFKDIFRVLGDDKFLNFTHGPLTKAGHLGCGAKCRPPANNNMPTIRFTSVENIDIFKMEEIIPLNF